MTLDSNVEDLDILTLTTTAAEAIATILLSQQKKAEQSWRNTPEGIESRKLRRELVMMHTEYHNIRELWSNSPGDELAATVEDIATCMNNAIDDEYFTVFNSSWTNDSETPRYQHLRGFVIALKDPGYKVVIFEEGRALRRGAAPSLIRRLSVLCRLLDSLIDDPISSYEKPIVQTVSTISFSAFVGPNNIKTSAERLHRSLHTGRPCSLEDHIDGHVGALGVCTHAMMLLDPRWITQGNENGIFFIILSGDNIDQECEVQFRNIRTEEKCDPLCLVSYEESKDYCLLLAPDDSDQLWDIKWDDPRLQDQSDLQYKFLTLQDLLDAFNSHEIRRAVQLILARSVLLLFQGIWVAASSGARLALDKVLIFCKVEHGMAYPSFDKIFVPTCFAAQTNVPRPQRNLRSHPFPDLLALGILIGQIEQRHILQGTKSDVAYARALRDMVKEGLGPGSGVFKAMNFCIEQKSFEGHLGRIDRECPQLDQEFIQDCYNNIIKPLEHDLKDYAQWSWEEITWKVSRQALHFGKATSFMGTAEQSHTSGNQPYQHEPPVFTPPPKSNQVATKPSQPTRPLVQLGANHVFDTPRCLATAEGDTETEDWFKQLKNTRTILNLDPMYPLEIDSLVKVAVLDTGIDLDHPELASFRGDGRLDSGIDFINKGQPIVDLNGHGTHMCHTLLRVAPYIKLYPMRVFNTTRADESTPLLVKKAIYYAIETLGVDIISMSFAFEEVEPLIQDALDNARRKDGKKVLMFAAASNYRQLRVDPIGYPARVADRVICVHSSLILGGKSTFSPDGIRGRANLSAPGDDVEAAYPLNLNNQQPLKKMSGTSCATPMVAGIAALLLHLAKADIPELEDINEWNQRKDELWETRAMRCVLQKCMTDQARIDGAHCLVKPWMLLEFSYQIIVGYIHRALQLKNISS